MAMSVAENAPVTTEKTPRGAHQGVAVGSFLGALYALVGLWFVLAGLPLIWDSVLQVPEYVNEFLSATLLLMLCAAVAVGIAYLGYRLLQNQHAPALRAGIFFAAVMIFVSLWIAEAAGNAIEDPTSAMITALVVAAVLLGGTALLFLQRGFGAFLESAEDQGWFQAASFKPSQGVRVRRGTVLGVLVLGVCGIYTLWAHQAFGSIRQGAANNWIWKIPGTEAASANQVLGLPIMYHMHLIMPVLLLILLILLAWRLVNVPVFADFLIATEAEMNKVSWTTRRRLIQDTVVVLVTVILMTFFLFIVDIFWLQLLSSSWVGVLHDNPRNLQQKQQEKNQW